MARVLKIKVWLQRKRDREDQRIKKYFSTRMGLDALGEKGPDLPAGKLFYFDYKYG